MCCSVVFATWRQCTLPCGHIGATWRIRLNLCFLRLIRVHNPNGISIGSAVFAQIMADTLQWVPLFPEIAPSHGTMGALDRHLTIPSAHLSPQPKRLRRFSRFCIDDRRVSLYFTMGNPFPLKIATSLRGICTPSNTWFPSST